MAPSDLLTVEQAQDILLSQLNAIAGIEEASLHIANWRVLAEDIISPIELPPANLSMMDGYAIAHGTSLTAGTSIKTTQRITAGEYSNTPLQAGEAARIFTGAKLPENTQTVVMQEQVTVHQEHIQLLTQQKENQNIRWQGSEVTSGQILLKKGTRLSPACIGLCASVGIAKLRVYRTLSVALLITGDELIEPGLPLSEGKIYNANEFLLEALLRAHGFNVTSLGVTADSLEDTVTRLRDAANFDAIITTGGVSVGEADYVKAAVEQLGHLDAWRVRMKPGKPFTFGRVNHTPFLGLPGNPVAAFTCFHLFVLPALRRLQGLPELDIQAEPVTADFAFTAGDRREYLRARVMTQLGQRVAQIYPNQGSAVLASTVWADGFIQVAEGTSIKPGDRVAFISFNQFRQ